MQVYFTAFTDGGQKYVAFGRSSRRLPVYKQSHGRLCLTEINSLDFLSSLTRKTNASTPVFRSIDGIKQQYGEVAKPATDYKFTVDGIFEADCKTPGAYWITTDRGEFIYIGESDDMSDALYQHCTGISEEANCIHDQDNYYPSKFGFKKVSRTSKRRDLVEQLSLLWTPLCTQASPHR